jgi:hypothetical protein
MKKIIPVLALAVVSGLSSGTALGQAGIFTGTLGISANGGVLSWYPVVSQANNGPSLFGGANLGTFNISTGQTLSLGGAEGLIFKNASAGADVLTVTLDYRIYLTSGSAGAFQLAPRDFTSQSGIGTGSVNDANGNVFTPGAGFQNQKWSNNPGGSAIPLNLLSGLSNGNTHSRCSSKAPQTARAARAIPFFLTMAEPTTRPPSRSFRSLPVLPSSPGRRCLARGFSAADAGLWLE